MSISHPPTGATPEIVEQVRATSGRSLPMVATEGRAHVVRYVNPPFCALVGQAADSMVGNPLAALSHDVDAAAVVLLDLVYSTGTPEFAVDLSHVVGIATAFRCAVWPILGEHGRPHGLLVKVNAPPRDAPTPEASDVPAVDLRDVNERLLVASLKAQEQAEIEITLRSEAEAALKLRDEFMSIASHELRTPVTGIKMSAQLALLTLEDGAPAAERQQAIRQYLVGIVLGANRLVVLMNDLMDVSRMRSGELLLAVTSIDLIPLVRVVALRYPEPGDEQHVVSLDVPDVPLVVRGDASRLEQVLDNLINNAIKYSPDGSRIVVALRRAVDGVVLTVRDAGIGLPPGSEESIFEPFGRAANARRHGLPGMGLGLHISRQIAIAHGGRMWVQSNGEGQGMTVGMWLPPA